MRRYIIIGSGAAGIAAVEAIRDQDPNGEIILIGDEVHGYYSRPGLAYLLTGEIPETQLYPFQKHKFLDLNIRRLHARVVQIDHIKHQIKLHNGKTIRYDRVLIATGASAFIPSLPGVDLEGVVKLDSLNDARMIINKARKARTAVVIGGGITALEIVEGLLKRGVKTNYFLRGERYWSSVLDDGESKIVENALREEGAVIHYHTEIGEILGKKGRVVAVRCKDDRVIRCDMVAIATGIRPRTGLAEASGLKIDRGLLVNQYMQTSAPDVFAAGDIAQVYDPFTQKYVIDSLWSPAREQGTIAGLNMTGTSKPYRKGISFNVTRLANLTTSIIGTVGKGVDKDLLGIARGDSEIWRQLPDAIAVQSNFEINRLRILVGKDTFLGAIVMGDQTLSKAIHHLIYNQVDIRPIRDQILRPQAPIADILADFWIPISQ